jgi:tetratricopeptide (TPR) repeat protein
MRLPVKLFMLLILLIQAQIFSADERESFKKGVQLYSEKEYGKALDLFIQIEKSNRHDPELYYNLGSCYYKLGRWGESRYYFEKALPFLPYDRDLEQSLMAVYTKVMKDPEFGRQEIMINRILYLVPPGLLFILFLISFTAISLSLILFILKKENRRIFMIVITVSLFFMILFTAGLVLQKNRFMERSCYIIQDNTALSVAPSENEMSLYTVSAGAKGLVVDEMENYFKIKMPDGASGWLKRNSVITDHNLSPQ